MEKLLGLIKLTRPYITVTTSLLFIGSTFLSTNGIPPMNPFLIGFTATVLAIASAHTFNDYLDWKFDARNPRTAKRPIPTGLISSREAFLFASGLAIIAFLLALLLNVSSILVALAAVPLPFIYSYLRRRKIPLGFVCPVAAAFLVTLFGSASVTGKVMAGNVPLLLALVLLWEPGRALNSEIQDVVNDRSSGISTLPVILSPKAAAEAVFILFSLTSAVGVLLGILSNLSFFYLTLASSAGLWLIYRSIELIKEPTTKNAVKMRIRAPRYLTIIIIVMIVDLLLFKFLH